MGSLPHVPPTPGQKYLSNLLTPPSRHVINVDMATKQVNDMTHTVYQTTTHRVGLLLDLVSKAAAENTIRSAAQLDRCGEVSAPNELELLNLIAIGSELMDLLPANVADAMTAGFTYEEATRETGFGQRRNPACKPVDTIANKLAAGALSVAGARNILP